MQETIIYSITFPFLYMNKSNSNHYFYLMYISYFETLNVSVFSINYDRGVNIYISM